MRMCVRVCRLLCIMSHYARILFYCLFCRDGIRNDLVQDAWIGLTKPTHDCPDETEECLRSGWTWVDGTPYNYSTFNDWIGEGEPDHSEHCARFTKKGWLGRACHIPFGYICEKGDLHCLNFLCAAA